MKNNMTNVFVKICIAALAMITTSDKITIADENVLDKEDLDFIKKSAYYGLQEQATDIKQDNEKPAIYLRKNNIVNKKHEPLTDPSKIIKNDFEKNYWKDVPFTKDYNRFFSFNYKNTIVHLVGWNYSDILFECLIGKSYIGAVLVSPVTKYCQNNSSWDERYNVLNYEIDNPSGTEEEFKKMVKLCNFNGVRVIVDVVLNNMAINSDKLKDCPVQSKTYPETECQLCGEKHPLYESSEFNGSCEIKPEDYKYNASNVRNCELKGRHDLIIRDENNEINPKIIMFLTKLIGFGVAGFRIIAASHMSPNELNELYSKLPSLRVDFNFPPRSRPFILNDVFDPFHDKTWAIQAQDYVQKGRVMDYKYGLKLAEKFKSTKSNIIDLFHWNDVSFVPKESAVVFLNNDSLTAVKGGLDGQPPINSQYIFNFKEIKFNSAYGEETNNLEKQQFIMAAVFMFSQRHEAILLTSTTSYLSEGKEIPLINGKVRSAVSYQGSIISYCVKDFMCEHRTPLFQRLMGFNQYIMSAVLDPAELPGGSLSKKYTFVYFEDNGNKIGYCVGKNGFVVINNTDSPLKMVNAATCFTRPGIYCDIVTGNSWFNKYCTGVEVEVNNSKQITFTLNPRSALVLQGDNYYNKFEY